jgi:DNA-binding MarR family transcriptional regulator
MISEQKRSEFARLKSAEKLTPKEHASLRVALMFEGPTMAEASDIREILSRHESPESSSA